MFAGDIAGFESRVAGFVEQIVEHVEAGGGVLVVALQLRAALEAIIEDADSGGFDDVIAGAENGPACGKLILDAQNVDVGAIDVPQREARGENVGHAREVGRDCGHGDAHWAMRERGDLNDGEKW